MLPWYDLIYSKKEKKLVHHVLLNWSTYYQLLSAKKRKRFVLRCIRFYKSINWKSHNKQSPSKQSKIIVSSAFTQITFGLRKHTLKDFDTILLLPRSYRYIKSDLMFNGDVNLSKKRITLAWPAVDKGFQIPDDSLNLCLHEFSHCLMLENQMSLFFSFFHSQDWKNYQAVAQKKMQQMKNGQTLFLRAYGGTNQMEFFAVALEGFFEQPAEFKRFEPLLYASLVRLLNQNPLNL
ncbi:MAG: zinc-dependent peptidase [Vicingaceae bacterium]